MKVTWWQVVAVVAGSILASGCNGSGGTDGGTGDATGSDALDGSDVSSTDGMGLDVGDPMTACTALATARCTKVDACSNGYGVARAWGSMGVCVSRETARCVAALQAPGTAATPLLAASCATGIAAQPCEDFLDELTPEACLPSPGPLVAGMACVVDAQCQSTVCLTPRTGVCGVCAPQPNDGDDCAAHSGCGRGLVCNHDAVTGAYTCRTARTSGAVCDADHPCARDLACVVALIGAGSGTCQPLATTTGAPCDATNTAIADCDANVGLFCNGSHRCASQSVASPGAGCGVSSDGTSDGACTAGGVCPSVASGAMRTCLAAAADGQPCDATLGPACLAPSRCVSTSPVGADAGTGGTCQPLVPTACH